MKGVSKLRRVLYGSARTLGDVQAVSSGDPERIIKREERKLLYRFLGSIIGRLLK